MDTGRALFDAIRGRGIVSRPPVAAAVDGLAARVAGMSHRELTRDAAAWANAVAKTTDLLDLDAVVVGFDFDLTMETLGDDAWEDVATRGPLGVAIETANRLFQVSRAAKGCIAVMVGPVTLAAQLFGEDEALERAAGLKPVQSAVARAWCETRPDLLLFLERAPFGKTGIGPPERRAYNALKNIATYYDVAPALWIEDYEPGCADGLDRLGMAFIVPVPATQETARFRTPGLGVVVPFEEPDAAPAAARAVATSGRERVFFMSRGALSCDVPIESLSAVIQDLRGVRVRA